MVGPSRMTLASDRPPSPHPGGGEREVQGTLRVGVGGATGRVSRERSNRGGVVLAQEAAGNRPRVLIHTPLREMAYFELNARRWQARVGRGVPPPMFVIYTFWPILSSTLGAGKRVRHVAAGCLLGGPNPPLIRKDSSRWSACRQGKSRGVEFDILQGREKRCIVSRSKWRFFLFAIFSGAKPSPACVVAGKGTIEPLCSALDVLGESLMASSTIVSMLLSPPIVDHLV